MKQVILAGATGLIGSFCLKQLLDSPDIASVTSFTRRPLLTKHTKLREKVVNFIQPDSFSFTGDHLDAIFCCLGTTIRKAGSKGEFLKVDLDYVLSLAKWGLKNRAQQFLVVSSMGADPNSSIFYNQTKGKMEAGLSQLGYPSVSVFRPSLLQGPRPEFRMSEKLGGVALKLLSPLMQGGLRNYRAISGETVAKAMVKCSLSMQPGFHLYLSGEISRLCS